MCVCECVCICMCVCACMCVYMCVCVCVCERERAHMSERASERAKERERRHLKNKKMLHTHKTNRWKTFIEGKKHSDSTQDTCETKRRGQNTEKEKKWKKQR